MTPVMLIISHLATIGAGVLCVVLFWGIDREMGYWVIINSMLGFLVNNVIKPFPAATRSSRLPHTDPWRKDAAEAAKCFTASVPP